MLIKWRNKLFVKLVWNTILLFKLILQIKLFLHSSIELFTSYIWIIGSYDILPCFHFTATVLGHPSFKILICALVCVWLCTRVCMRAQVCNNKSYRMQFKRDCQTHIYAVFFYVLNARCVILLLIDFIFGRSWNTRASSKCVNFLCSSRRREIVENRLHRKRIA